MRLTTKEMNRQLNFKDEKLQSLFDKNGYVKVRLLDEKKTDELGALFKETREEHGQVKSLHHTTTDTGNIDIIYQVDAKIKSLFIPALEKILSNFKPLVGCFHVKEPGQGSQTGIHQDPTFVDETKYCSANVWLALHDIDEKNGNLLFIKGSNRIMPSLRVTPKSSSYYRGFYQELPKIATPMPLKKGEAVIFNNETIHGATENLSDEVRLAATLLVCSAEAEWKIYYQDEASENDKIERYKLDLETFATMPKDGRPRQEAFEEYITAEFPQITEEEFLKKVGEGPIKPNKYLQKLKAFFE